MLTRLFEDLQEEKRQLKANYRQDKSDLEERQERILDRLERLDKEDKDLIDVEGVMVSLSDTANKLSGLIPDIPVDVLLEKTAEKMAELEPNILIPEEEPMKVIEESGIKPRPWRSKEVMEFVTDLLIEHGQPMTSKEIEEQLKSRYGWEWKSFAASFSKWRKEYPNMIVKKGMKYTFNI